MKIENGGNFNLPTINVNCDIKKALFNFYKKTDITYLREVKWVNTIYLKNDSKMSRCKVDDFAEKRKKNNFSGTSQRCVFGGALAKKQVDFFI